MSKVHIIRPTGVYTVEVARASLGLAKATISREIRLGRLRVSRRAGRYFLMGAWLLEWINAGEIRGPEKGDEASGKD